MGVAAAGRYQRVSTEFLDQEKDAVPELLQDGLPARIARVRFDFTEWADGQAWKFVKGQDYDSATETFRTNVRKWAKANGHEVELRPYPALDDRGEEIPLTKQDAVALGVRFVAAAGGNGSKPPAARAGS